MAKGKKGLSFGKKITIALLAGGGAFLGSALIPLSPITIVAGAALGAYVGYHIVTGEKFTAGFF